MPCICKTPESNSLGSYTVDIDDLTDSSTKLFKACGPQGETGVYKCNLCNTIWLFEYINNDTDRPPFFFSYRKITPEELKSKFDIEI